MTKVFQSGDCRSTGSSLQSANPTPQPSKFALLTCRSYTSHGHLDLVVSYAGQDDVENQTIRSR
eukprot:762633-Hanusia_phi.AAC.1